MGFSLDVATSAREDASNIVTEENSAEIVLDMDIDGNKNDDVEDREEGEIIEDTPVEYEDISSDEEVNLRQRIQELEARNIELEKIASISSAKATLDYANDQIPFQYKGLANQKQTFINLVDDDDDADDDENDDNEKNNLPKPSNSDRHYCYRKQRKSLKLSKSTRKERSSSIKHERKHSRCRRHPHRNKQTKKEPSKPYRAKSLTNDRDYSSEDENTLLLDREKLRAALRRDTHTPHRSTTSLRKKLKVVKQTVAEVMDNDEIDEDEVKSNKEIFELLESIVDNSEPGGSDKDSDIEDETISLEEQELRLIALKSAIIKKHETRKKRKVIEARPYSPTDTDITMEEFSSKLTNSPYCVQDDPDICVISPIPSSPPLSFDKSLLPVDMDIVCSEASQSPIFFNEMPSSSHIMHHINNHTTGIGPWMPITDIPLPSDHTNIVHTENHLGIFKSTLQPIMMIVPDEIEPAKSPEDVEMTDTNYLPDKIDSPKSCLLLPENVNATTDADATKVISSPQQQQQKQDDSYLDDEEENALRALLIANLGSPKNAKRKLRTTTIIGENHLPKTDNIQPTSFLPPSSDITVHKHINNSVAINQSHDITAVASQPLFSIINNSSSMLPPPPSFVPIILQKENREIVNIPNITINLKEAVKRIKTKYNTQANQKQANIVIHNHNLQQVKQLSMARNNRNDGKNSNLIVVNLNSKLPLITDKKKSIAEIENENVIETNTKPAAKPLTVPIIEAKKTEKAVVPLSEPLPVPPPHVIYTQNKDFTLINPPTTTIETNRPLNLPIMDTKKSVPVINTQCKDSTLLSKPAAVAKANPLTVKIKKAEQVVVPSTEPHPVVPHVTHSQTKDSSLVSKPAAVVTGKSLPVSSVNETKKPVSASIKSNPAPVKNPINNVINKRPKTMKPDQPAKKPKMITNPQAKQVKQLVIQLQNSDTDTETDLDDIELSSVNITENDRFFDNASPSSIAMDSPSCGPCSPITSNTATETNDATADNSVLTTPAFEQKLDEFLKKVRTKQEHENETKIQLGPKKVAILPKKANNATATKLSGTPKTPLAVRHLPASAQLEYRTLVTRMRNLEKQKTIRQQTRPTITNLNHQQQSTSSTLKVIPFTVTIPNDQVNIDNNYEKISSSPIGDLKITLKNTGDRVIQTCSTNNTTTANNMQTPTKSDSLVKQVLVKNVSIKVQKQNALAQQQQQEHEQESKINTNLKSNLSTMTKMEKSIITPSKLKKKPIIVDNLINSQSNVAKRLPPLPDVAKMPDEDKQNLLKTAEKDYIQHSSKLMNEIENMHSLVCSAKIAKQKQFDLESEYDSLKLRMQEIEEKMNGQKMIISKLYPNISTSHKTVLNNRQQSILLSSYCMKIGKLVSGDEYKIPDDNKISIVEKLKIIAMDTKLLKTMKKSTPNIADTDRKLSMDTIPVSNEFIANEENSCKITAQSNVVENTSIELTTQTTKMDNSSKIANDIDDASQVGKYRSPLDHMQNESSQNPDAILCPFQLMGQCEDKECSYKHLK